MPATYEPIATTTLGSAASTITFSSIPATYTDIKLVFVGTANTGTNCLMRFNSDSATNYSRTYIIGDGASASSARNSNVTVVSLTIQNTINATTPTMRTADIFSYAGSTNKTVLTTETSDLNGSGSTVSAVQLWRNTAAITSLSLETTSGATFSIGTTATLYGIKNA